MSVKHEPTLIKLTRLVSYNNSLIVCYLCEPYETTEIISLPKELKIFCVSMVVVKKKEAKSFLCEMLAKCFFLN